MSDKLIKYLIFELDNLKIPQKKALLVQLWGDKKYNKSYHIREVAFNWGLIVDNICETVPIVDIIKALVSIKAVNDLNLLLAYFIVSDFKDRVDTPQIVQLRYWYDYLQSHSLWCEWVSNEWGYDYSIEYDICNYYNVGLGVGYQKELLETLIKYLAPSSSKELDLYHLGHDRLINTITQLLYIRGC